MPAARDSLLIKGRKTASEGVRKDNLCKRKPKQNKSKYTRIRRSTLLVKKTVQRDKVSM